MKKSDLKTGMWVEMRNGGMYLVLKDIDTKNYGHQDIFFAQDGGFMTGEGYTETLESEPTYKCSSGYDVVKVYGKATDNFIFNKNRKGALLWQREEPISMSLTEAQDKLTAVIGKPVKIKVEG